METRALTIDMPMALLARIETLAHARRISVGQLLRDELSRHLGGEAEEDAVIDWSDTGPVVRRAAG